MIGKRRAAPPLPDRFHRWSRVTDPDLRALLCPGRGAVTVERMDSSAPRSAFVPGKAIDGALVTAWRGLARRAAERNPFMEPEVVLPAVRHLAGRSRAGLLTVTRNGRLDAVLAVSWPLAVPIGRRWVPVPVPVLQAWVEPFSVESTPLLDADDPVGAMAALLRPPPSLPVTALFLRFFGEAGPVAAALDQALAGRGQRALRMKTYQRALLPRDGAPPPNRNRKNRHKRLARDRQAMEEALGPVRVVDRSADPAAVEEFLALEVAGWKGRAGTALASTEREAVWFREACDGLRAADQLQVLALEAGGRTSAMLCNFGAGAGQWHLKSAYDEALAEFRPGNQLVGLCEEVMAAGPYDFLDSGTVPDNALFNQLWPGRRTLSTVLVPLHGPIGGATVAAARRLVQVRNRAGVTAGSAGVDAPRTPR